MSQPQILRAKVLIDLAELVEGLGGAAAAGPALDWAGFPAWLAVEATSAALLLPAERLRWAGAVTFAVDVAPGGPARGPLSDILAELAPVSEVRVVLPGPKALGECRACELAGTPRCHHCRNTSSPASRFDAPAGAAIAAELFRMVREDAFGVAVVLSTDRGLLPAVRFVEGRGKRVVLAAFPPRGRELSAACSGMIDLAALRP